MQYNGASSCWKCLQPGDTASVGQGLYNETGPDARQTTQNQQQQKN